MKSRNVTKKSVFIITLLLVTVAVTNNSFAYEIEFSKYGLVSPAKAWTGLHYTSPFDAEWDSDTQITDIWLTDMSGSYSGRRVFNWVLDESGGGQVWTYIGGFTTTNGSGIRALNIKSETEIIVAHVDGTIAIYDRAVAASYATVLAPISTFSIAGSPHHMAFDGTWIWTNTDHAGFPTSGIVYAYDLSGTLVKTVTSVATYIEGIARTGDHLYIYNAGASIYGHPSDGMEGWILKYDLDGNYVDGFEYETGDRPPFHSEALSWDGGHFWMAGYADGKVYRMKGEELPGATIAVDIDIKPTSCPNPLKVNSKGNAVIPVAILGSDELDVMDIDISTITLEGVSPIRSAFEDVATPSEGEECECTTEQGDGFLDLTLKFSRNDILAALEACCGPLEDLDNKTEIPLYLTAMLTDGDVTLEGTDCVRILNKGKKK